MCNRVKHYWTFVLTIIIINSRKINSMERALSRGCSLHMINNIRKVERRKKERTKGKLKHRCKLHVHVFKRGITNNKAEDGLKSVRLYSIGL